MQKMLGSQRLPFWVRRNGNTESPLFLNVLANRPFVIAGVASKPYFSEKRNCREQQTLPDVFRNDAVILDFNEVEQASRPFPDALVFN